MATLIFFLGSCTKLRGQFTPREAEKSPWDIRKKSGDKIEMQFPIENRQQLRKNVAKVWTSCSDGLKCSQKMRLKVLKRLEEFWYQFFGVRDASFLDKSRGHK